MKPKTSELPVVNSLNKLSCRARCRSTFLGFLSASPMKFGVPLGNHSLVGVHLLGEAYREPLTNNPHEEILLKNGDIYVLQIIGTSSSFYRRFKTKKEAIEWFHMIEVLDTASHSLLWVK